MQVWVGNAYQMRWSVLERLHVFSTWRQLGRLRATLFPSYDAQSRVVSTFRGKLSSYFDLSSLKSVPKEGGLFVHLKHGVHPEEALRKLKDTTLNGRTIKPYVVKGKPFVDDIPTLRPSRRLAITWEQGTEESVYNVMRQFGRIWSLEQSAGTYIVSYSNLRYAINAKNVLHGALVNGTPLTIKYQAVSNYPLILKAWQSVTHSKLAIPIFLIGTSLTMFFLINPIRIANVTEHLAMNWQESSSIFPDVWVDREEEEYLSNRFQVKPSSVLLISGANGVGKTALLRKILRDRKFAVRIDCTKLQYTTGGASNEFIFIDNLSNAVGFRPSFSALNTMLSYVESAMMIKQSPVTGTRESQLSGLLSTIQQALKMISKLYPTWRGGENKNFDYVVIVFDGFEDLQNSLEADPTDSKSRALLEMLFEFAYNVTEVEKTAHVAFVSSNVYGEEKIRHYPMLRGKIDTLEIKDLSEEKTIEFIVKNQTKSTQNSKNPDQEKPKTNEMFNFPLVFEAIGGRIKDLTSLMERVKRGDTVEHAISSLLDETKRDVAERGFSKLQTPWTHAQFWKLIHLFKDQKTIPYNDVLLNVFLGDKEALKGLTQADLLVVTEKDGIEYVSPISKLVDKAFSELSNEQVFKTQVEKSITMTRMKTFQDKINAIVSELVQLEETKLNDKQVLNRKRGLVEKLGVLDEKLRKEQQIFATFPTE